MKIRLVLLGLLLACHGVAAAQEVAGRVGGRVLSTDSMPLADVFRMERTLVRNAFKPRGTGGQARCAEVLEGVQALVVDKGRAALWHPARIAEVDAAEVEGFFHQVWPPAAHPLRDL